MPANNADIIIIGSGAAATTTLIELFNKLLDAPGNHQLINITVIEKHPEFWKGIPYGPRSSINSLTITGVSDFVSVDKEKQLFQKWLKENHDEWTRYYRLNGGLAAQQWLEINLPLIEQDNWHDVYLPRFVFGRYMQQRLLNLLHRVEEDQLAKISLIQAEAIAVKSVNDIYEVTLEHPDKTIEHIQGKKLVIAIGSSPVKAYDGGNKNKQQFSYINDIYEPSIDDNLKTLSAELEKTTNENERNVLIIGSNASCIELLYILNNRPDIVAIINQIVVISRAGKMPYHISETELDNYSCPHLTQVKYEGNYDVHSLIAATKKDIAAAIDDTAIIPHLNHIIGYTIELLQALDESSKNVFFSIYGPQITKLIRRSGPAYKGAADNLIAVSKLELLKGEFINIEPDLNGGQLNYIDADSSGQIYPLNFKVIINCSGSNKLRETSSRLLYSLIHNNLCRLTLSGEGIQVNEKFEAAPNLYIMGPLLAGNVNKIIHFWHLENVSRMLYLAPYLAGQLV